MSEEERDKIAADAAEDLELQDETADAIVGGDKAKPVTITQDVTVNKMKTANKAFDAMDGYIRG